MFQYYLLPANEEFTITKKQTVVQFKFCFLLERHGILSVTLMYTKFYVLQIFRNNQMLSYWLTHVTMFCYEDLQYLVF